MESVQFTLVHLLTLEGHISLGFMSTMFTSLYGQNTRKNFLFPTTMMCTFRSIRMLTTFNDFKRNFDQKRTKQHHGPNCCSPFLSLLSNYNGLFCRTLFFIFKLTRKRSATILITLGLIMIYDSITFTAQNSVHSAHSPMA